MNKAEDIEQLIYRELPPDRYCYIHNYIIDLKSQLQQKENIIKEVRELLNKSNISVIEYTGHEDYEYDYITDKVIEILDKENK